MNIALISTPMLTCPPKSYGGLEIVVFDLACSLTKLGHKVVLFAPNGSQVPPKGFLVECGEAKDTVNVDWLKAEKDMWEKYKDKLVDFDIIHSHDWFGFCYASKAINLGLKVTHTHHGHLNLDWWGKSKPLFKLNLIAISKWMSDIYRIQGLESKYVYNGVDLEKYQFKKEKGDRLLFVGRIDSFKQPNVAIEVAKKLRMGLDIVGGTFVQNTDYLEKIRQSCTNGIRFYPDASQDVKEELMQNAKCLIFPSAMGEPFGLVAVEAMACGTPVVALNDGAIGEVVQEGGVVCDVFDKSWHQGKINYALKRDPVDALCEAVRKLSVAPEVARKNAELFSRENMAKSYLQCYYDILEGKEW